MLHVFIRAHNGARTTQPGRWWPHTRADQSLGASVSCPSCAGHAVLEHTIAHDGTITPSIDCPFEGCDFHAHGRLEGWDREVLS